VSRLRAKCPDCRTYTAVALGPDYECHSCGATFGAGLVRVPRAWGTGGEAMARAANLPLRFPEALVVDEPSLGEQTLAVAAELPERPVVLGGCCCAHIGAVQALAQRHERLGLVWLDAHGDLNTPETTLTGNTWGMPLRMLLDAGAVAGEDVALVGARALDPAEEELLATGLPHSGDGAVDRALDGVDAVYVALDCDVLDPSVIAVLFPEPAGLSLGGAEAVLQAVRERADVVGAGVSGLVDDEANVAPVMRLCAALGL
jgi:arginase family enzyme